MPLGTSTGKHEPKSLRSLTAIATATHFFEKDRTLLGKVYRHGILPVRVINDIYCEWAMDAIEKSKANFATTYDNYAKEWKGMKIAKERLTEQELMYRRDESMIAKLRNVWETRVSKTRAYYAQYKAHIVKLKEVLDGFDAIFSLVQRIDVINAAQDWDIHSVREELFKQIKAADQEFLAMPVKFNSVQGDAQIKVSEVDELCH